MKRLLISILMILILSTIPSTYPVAIGITNPIDDDFNFYLTNRLLPITVYNMGENYLKIIINSAIVGDIKSGELAARHRNFLIDFYQLKETKIEFNDLFLLAKIITHEAGAEWLSEEWKLAVGEVLLNRVASLEFPNTIEDCVYEKNQYANVTKEKFQNLLPKETEILLALRLLQGERYLIPSAVFQAEFKQGSEVYKVFKDPTKILSTTYICLSKNKKII